MRILVTGGSGFIGSAVIRYLIADSGHQVLNLDKLTYASTVGSLASVAGSDRYQFVRGDICDEQVLAEVFKGFAPTAVLHLAAESHVDRSIDAPDDFIQTNLVGTFRLLEAARAHNVERFHHVSTDEVFGTLPNEGPGFNEQSPYAPHSPYSASKAGSDHLVRSWQDTYGLNTVLTNCSNNYGPFQFPEKLIPLATIRAIHGEPIPVYGTGLNVRDWLHVSDHARALVAVLENGEPGETYAVGGNEERTTLQVVHAVCEAIDGLIPGRAPAAGLIEFVADRPGHDLRYAIDATKIQQALGWQPSRTFDDGIRETVAWYINNQGWWAPLLHADATLRRGIIRTASRRDRA